MKLITNLQGNLFGGITAGIIALPLGLAFGVASGMGAAAGVYGAIILGFFASLLGGTNTQISGPTGPMTVVVGAALTTFGGDLHLMASVVLLAGVLQIIFGFIRVGKWVHYIPYPVISGFMSGIGVIIIIMQLNPFLGVASDSSVPRILWNLPSSIGDANIQAIILATLTLAVMLFTPKRIGKVIPAPLIALVLLSLVSIFMSLNVDTIGEIPRSLPDFIMPAFSFDQYRDIIVIGITLALLGTIDTLLTSIVADSLTHTRHNSNRELFGQGIGNALCALVGAMPGAGATMRTVINIKSGGTTKLSGMIHALILLSIVVFFAPYAAQIPIAVLAGILIKVGLDILDYRFISIWKKSPRNDLAVMVTVFLFTVFVDLITAVGIGVVLSSLLIVYRIAKETNIAIDNSTPYDTAIHQQLVAKNARLIRVDGAFFFGTNTVFETSIHAIMDNDIVIVDVLNVSFIDITAIFTLKDLINKMHDNEVQVVLVVTSEQQALLMKFNRMNIFDRVQFCKSVQGALDGITVSKTSAILSPTQP